MQDIHWNIYGVLFTQGIHWNLDGMFGDIRNIYGMLMQNIHWNLDGMLAVYATFGTSMECSNKTFIGT
jgi:DNA-binding ferritin-like protein